MYCRRKYINIRFELKIIRNHNTLLVCFLFNVSKRENQISFQSIHTLTDTYIYIYIYICTFELYICIYIGKADWFIAKQ